MTWLAALYVAGSYFAFLYLAGSWSWFGGAFRHVLPALLLIAVWWTYLHGNPETILDFRPSLDFLLSIVMGTFFAALTVYSVRGRLAPASGLELQFPVRGGTFVVTQGGASRVLNHHYVHPSQRYALDIVKLESTGTRARGLYPAEPERYAMWECEVVSPCEARVAAVVDGHPDLYPPVRDPEHPGGNHVVLEVNGATIYLAHLKQGSICVRAGDRVRAGQILGRAGNSGSTTEPHLHLHAEEGPYRGRFSGMPAVPIRFDGRFLVRNDMVRIRAGIAVTTPERDPDRVLNPEIPVVGDSA
ncbi:MAG TPA: M23 family metallopeptidase [Candidatus Eisenbacteria bacterium]|nr:M23 family metallopeptidase [Candidatus Eisenbacteria bacterium]